MSAQKLKLHRHQVDQLFAEWRTKAEQLSQEMNEIQASGGDQRKLAAFADCAARLSAQSERLTELIKVDIGLSLAEEKHRRAMQING
ncbi:hypothetical protein [Pseudomonas sp. LRF_L74]|uniref:hypothetical protein n=1 Tax=Pseudomonas sp. LRF_L74 TaxID=3369422 RepID=UPI003F60FA4D